MAKYRFNIDWGFDHLTANPTKKQRDRFFALTVPVYNQNWGVFYQHEFMPAKLIGNTPEDFYHDLDLQIEEKGVFFQPQTEETETNIVVEDFVFDKMAENSFDTKWGKFYKQAFVPGPEFEITKPVKTEKPSWTPVHMTRSRLLNPIDMIEEIVQELSDAEPIQTPAPEKKTIELIEDAPEEIHLRKLKPKAMGSAGRKLLDLIAKSK